MRSPGPNQSLTARACYLLKLHGDYKDARILNTEAELSGYPAPFDALLDRILDEHRLIVCGWSGEWDHELRAAFLRAPNRRYSVFWAARGNLGSGAQELVDHRRARVIPIIDADGFFSSLRQRVETLEQSMAGVLGRWGEDTELPLVLDIIRSLYAQAEKVGGGLTVFLNLRSYPAVLVFTAYGLSLTRAGRWSALHRFFDAVIHREYRDPKRAVKVLFLWAWKGTANEAWKQIEGLEQRRTPLSDHLLALFLEWSRSFIGLAPDFELIFERFELLGSLAHLERNDKASLEQELAGEPRQGWAWMPVGRAGWHELNADRLLGEIHAEPLRDALIRAGFAKSDPDFLDLFVKNFRRIAARMRW